MNRYIESKILKNPTGTRYYSTLVYPIIEPSDEDFYVITTTGDRLDIIANQYYGDVSLWPIIYFANPSSGLKRYSVFVVPGIQIRIPNPDAVSDILNQLDAINKAR